MHQQQFGRPPRLVTADAGLFSMRNGVDARERGVKRVAIPNLGTRSAAGCTESVGSAARKWRTGCEGRISLRKRRHGF